MDIVGKLDSSAADPVFTFVDQEFSGTYVVTFVMVPCHMHSVTPGTLQEKDVWGAVLLSSTVDT